MRLWFGFGLYVAGACALWAQDSQSGTIRVRVEDVIPGKGQVRMALENNANDFDSGSFDTPKYLSSVVDAKATSEVMIFASIPYGTYAIKVFQDLDRDGKLKTGFMGAPDEPWGFSNDASGFIGPAEFSDAKFELKDPTLELTIHLKK